MIDPESIPDSALKRLGGALTELLDDDQWNNIEKNYLLPALEDQEALRARVVELRSMLAKSCDEGRGDPEHPVCSRAATAEACVTELRAALQDFEADQECENRCEKLEARVAELEEKSGIYREALEHIVKHMEITAGGMAPASGVYVIATKALTR